MLTKVLKSLGDILTQLASEQARIEALEAEVNMLKAQLLYKPYQAPTWQHPHFTIT